MAQTTMRQMVPNALMAPPGISTCEFSQPYNSLIGQKLKRLVIKPLSPVLKITWRKGASITREKRAKTADRILNKKYKPTNPGYRLIYRKIVSKLLIKGQSN